MPTPTKVLELRGSWRAKARKGEPKLAATKPRMPDWLSEEAQKVWKRLTALLQKAGLIATVDEFALTRYCVTFARWKEAEQWLQQWGTTCQVKHPVTGAVVGLVSWPQVKQAASLAEQLQRIEQNFGLSPAARARLTTQEEEDDGAQSRKAAQQTKDKARFFRPRVG
jgi:P27 family predicted phage terminase small subunit